MENNKSKKMLGSLSIVWGVILLIYQILRNTVLSDWYSDAYMKQVLTYGSESAQQFKLGFETFNNILSIAFLVSLIVIVIFIIIVVLHLLIHLAHSQLKQPHLSPIHR